MPSPGFFLLLISHHLLTPTATSASGFEDPTTISFHIGNRVNQTTAVEFGYVDLDKFDSKRIRNSCIEISGIDISVIELVPIGESAYVEDDSLLFGLGADVPLGNTLGARLEWTKYFDIEDENVYTLTLGLFVNF